MVFFFVYYLLLIGSCRGNRLEEADCFEDPVLNYNIRDVLYEAAKVEVKIVDMMM